VTRIVGLPNATDDIGNWGEPLGMASLLVEGSPVALGSHVLAERRLAGRTAQTSALRLDRAQRVGAR
jgi:hypothetical protein